MKEIFEIVNPVSCPSWNDSIASGLNPSFFHTANWASVLSESYDYKPKFFIRRDSERITSIIPLMEIETFLTARRGVSLPFTDCCDPIMEKGDQFQRIIDDLIDYGKQLKWRYLELRTIYPLPGGVKASEIFHGHLLNISGSGEEIMAGFRDSTRRNIRKAEKEGVAVIIDGGEESLRQFYRLNCMTRRDHGLPCQPYLFFEKVHAHIISKNLGMLVLAAINGKIVAGALFFHFRDRAIYKYGASDREYQHLRCNNLIMWKAIQWYQCRGFRSIDLGRTERENAGLMQFKRGWGATEYPINYYKYDFRRNCFITGNPKVSGWHNHVFRRLPLPLLRIAGTLLYRHVG